MPARLIIPPDELREHGITIGDKQRRRLEAAGQFPRRVWVTARTHGYVLEEILAHLQALIATRDAELAKPAGAGAVKSEKTDRPRESRKKGLIQRRAAQSHGSRNDGVSEAG
jgi:predicted DNA-binding transcriptional regulator AlpA